ncbi:MAG: peptidoglycan recognition protein family protein, partial [Planctomycetes bacterium]|nr:peptidoglycan recognition protein family protein [Planctomycetota bacterium]
EECRFLIAYAQGRPIAASDAGLAARVSRYTDSSVASEVRPVAASSSDVLIDVPRAAWGAKALLANHDRMNRPYRITVHHTAEPAHTHELHEGKREMRDLQHTHQQGNGWADLGYHFLIDQAGRVYEGRSLSAQGAHAGNADLNRGNIGICLIGNFVAQPERGSEYARAQAPTFAQLQKLGELVDGLQVRFGIDDSQLWAHSHLKETACPGPVMLDWVRNRRASR